MTNGGWEHGGTTPMDKIEEVKALAQKMGHPIDVEELQRDSAPIITNLEDCARCGGDHKGAKFEPLTRQQEWTHFWMCPNVDEPVMLNWTPGGAE